MKKSCLIEKNNSLVIDEKIKNFLDKIYMSLENVSYEELIEITLNGLNCVIRHIMRQ